MGRDIGLARVAACIAEFSLDMLVSNGIWSPREDVFLASSYIYWSGTQGGGQGWRHLWNICVKITRAPRLDEFTKEECADT